MFNNMLVFAVVFKLVSIILKSHCLNINDFAFVTVVVAVSIAIASVLSN